MTTGCSLAGTVIFGIARPVSQSAAARGSRSRLSRRGRIGVGAPGRYVPCPRTSRLVLRGNVLPSARAPLRRHLSTSPRRPRAAACRRRKASAGMPLRTLRSHTVGDGMPEQIDHTVAGDPFHVVPDDEGEEAISQREWPGRGCRAPTRVAEADRCAARGAHSPAIHAHLGVISAYD